MHARVSWQLIDRLEFPSWGRKMGRMRFRRRKANCLSDWIVRFFLHVGQPVTTTPLSDTRRLVNECGKVVSVKFGCGVRGTNRI
jgi:hypothetical protein